MAPLLARAGSGLRLDLPADWTLLDDKELAVAWRTPASAVVFASFHPEATHLGPETLEDHIADLRLIAAARGGGLVACGLDPVLGVLGLTLEPRPDGQLAAVARALLPSAGGHVQLGVVADGVGSAGPITGEGRDPFGFDYAPVTPLPGTGLGHAPWPSDLRLAREDELGDTPPAGHPLGPVRAALEQLRRGLRLQGPEPVPPPVATTIEGVTFDLPAGLLPAPEWGLDHGGLFRRVTFERRLALLTVCRHPELHHGVGAAAGTRALVERQLACSRAQLLQGPHVEATLVAGRAALLVEHESLFAGRGPIARHSAESPQGGSTAAWTTAARSSGRHRRRRAPASVRAESARRARSAADRAARSSYSVGAWLPWDDHLLEVTVSGERDDWWRLQRLLERVVASVRVARRPALVPHTGKHRRLITDGGRRRIYRILCHLAHTDGKVQPREREVVEAQRVLLGLSPAEALHLEAQGRAGQELQVGSGIAEQAHLLGAMIEVVAAHGRVLDQLEQRRLTEVALACGCPRATLAELLVARLSGPHRSH